MEKIENYADLIVVIKNAMASKGVTQSELAKAIGCHQPQVARMLKDDHSPTVANVFKVCNYLKISIGVAFSL